MPEIGPTTSGTMELCPDVSCPKDCGHSFVVGTDDCATVPALLAMAAAPS